VGAALRVPKCGLLYSIYTTLGRAQVGGSDGLVSIDACVKIFSMKKYFIENIFYEKIFHKKYFL
jgi:hypothetical protein